jgi:16S rRNA (adenine1518-N6/adenine1519-N6)-dimethyltransferase
MAAIRAKKQFGQNFLKSGSVVGRIILELRPRKTDKIVEIGPGKGALTLPLGHSGASVWAVELDRDLVEFLQPRLNGFNNVRLVNADFLKFKPRKYGIGQFKLIGNLPYNITSPVLDWCLRRHKDVELAVFMMQKELAARLAGSPGSKDWAPLSIFTQMYFEVEHCFNVAPHHFSPPPQVTSSVVRLVPRRPPPAVITPALERVVRTSFRHRRKQLINNLAGEILPDNGVAREIYADLGLPGTVRAEELSIEQFLKLTDALAARKLV